VDERPLGHWGTRVYEGLGYLGGAILAVMTAAVIGSVALRWLGSQLVEGLDELPRFLFVWLVMIGAAAAMHRGHHTTLDFFRDRFGPRGRLVAMLLTNVIGILFFLSLIKTSLVLVPNSQLQTSASLGLPLGYVYASVPVGAALIILPMAWRAARIARELWQKRS
jgi:TRAP-type C4-dicarboxylate transport system permease small subunit